METKIQLLTGDKLNYVNLSEFILMVSSQLNQNAYKITIPQNEENQFMRITEVCDVLSITKPTIYVWCEKGVLKPIKIQSRVYFDRKEVMSLLENKKSQLQLGLINNQKNTYNEQR